MSATVLTHGLIGTTSLRDLDSLRLSRQRYLGWRSDHFRRCIWLEHGAIDPDPMENDSNAAREGDHRTFTTTPLRELGSPRSQPCRPATVHHDGRSLA